MSLARFLQTIVFLVAAISFDNAAHCQVLVYQLNGGIYGNLEGLVSDIGNTSFGDSIPPSSQGYAPVSLGTMTDTIYWDPANLTLRQVAVFSSTGTSTLVLNETHTVAGQSVAGTLTLTQGLAGGSLTLDSGNQPVVWNAGTHSYCYPNQSFASSVQLNSIAIGGSYSLLTGGESYSGNFNYSLHPADNGSTYPTLYTSFSPSADETSMDLGGAAYYNGYVAGNGFASVTAADGFRASLVPGDSDDHLQSFDTTGNGPATAMLVPEPGSTALLGMGLLMLTLAPSMRRRKDG